MIFGKRLTRALGLGLAVSALTLTVNAQNESNWHPGNNDFDGFYLGLQIGGGLTTKADGIGKWIPGEDLRGSRKAVFSGDFGFKVRDFNSAECFLNAGGGGFGTWTPLITYWEFDGRNPNRPDVYTNPTCIAPGLVMGTATGEPLGDPPGTSASLLIVGLPTGIGTASVTLPNNGILPTVGGGGGTLALISAFGIGGGTATLPTGCYSLTIGAVTTIVPSLDDIDGWWIWNQDSRGVGTSANYYGFSFDEPDVWRSNTLQSVLASGGVLGFPSTTEWAMHQTSIEAATTAALAPAGSAAAGEANYYGVTENTNSGFGALPPTFDFHGGYDVGPASEAISLGGSTGYADDNDVTAGAPVAAAQDPAGSSGVSPTYFVAVGPTLGFHTWDTRDYNGNGLSDDGGEKVVLMAFNWDMFAGVNPDVSPDVLGSPATRLPVTPNTGFTGGDFPQALTVNLVPTFAHTVIGGSATFTSPTGFTAAQTGDLHQTGTSAHLPTSSVTGVCFGVEIAVTYGTLHLVGGNPTYNPAEGSTSGRKVLFLLD